MCCSMVDGSNNTNKLSPQEQVINKLFIDIVQIIQINLVLKNLYDDVKVAKYVQIIQINLVLKNPNDVVFNSNGFK